MKNSKSRDYADLGFKALRRAAIKAAEDAQRSNLKIPISKNGHVVYVAPEEIIRKNLEAEGI